MDQCFLAACVDGKHSFYIYLSTICTFASDEAKHILK